MRHRKLAYESFKAELGISPSLMKKDKRYEEPTLLNNWKEEEIIKKENIINFDFLMKRSYIKEIEGGYYYLDVDIDTVELELWKFKNEELANILNITDINKEIKQHIKNLNRYNELKDIAQALIGRIAELRQTTVKQVHEELDLPTDS